MKIWIVGKAGIEKCLSGVYERSDQAFEVAEDTEGIYSIEVGLANSCQCVQGVASSPRPIKIESQKETEKAKPKKTTRSK
ncbi:MAG: hypothetical protein ACE5IR_09545 [bacterium]